MHIFGTDIDLNSNEFINLKPENLLSFPAVTAADTGRIVMNTGLGSFFGYNGTEWKDLALDGGGAYTLPVASDVTLGGVKVDGVSISINGSSILNVVPGFFTLDFVTDNGNTTTNPIYTGKVWTSNIQNNDTGNLTISGNQSLILRAYNPNDGFVNITNNGTTGVITDNETIKTLLVGRNFNDTVVAANTHQVGVWVRDTVNMSTKTGSPDYTAIKINPNVQNISGQFYSIDSSYGDARFDDGNLTLINGIIVSTGYTVATLPTGIEGGRAHVTDANSTTFMSTVSGGGSNKVPVFYNGTNWVIG